MRNSFIKSVTLLTLLLFVGVGNMWGGTKRVFCYWGYVDWWDDDGCKMCLHAWGSSTLAAADFEMEASDIDKVLYYDLDESYTSLCFFRAPSVDVSKKTNQTVDITIGTNNRWDIWTSKSGDNQEVAAQRWVNGAAIDGLLNPKNPHTQAFNGDGEFTATLVAHSTYEFKVLDNITLYGLNEDVLTSSVSEQTLNTSGYQVRLCTAGAGDYKFTWDSENKKLSVDYPDVDHPNIDYCYVIKYDSWNPDYDLHVWGGTSTYVAEWNPNSTISGTTAPGVDLSNYVTIGGTNYFYIAPGNFTDFVVTKNNHATDRSYDVKSADGYGKGRSWADGDGWQWRTFTVRIQLNDLSATTHVVPTYQDVAFNSDVLTDLTSVPAKTHYDFGGFYTGYDDVNDVATGTQVIDANGQWIASVADYTDASKHWIHAGTETTLYAMWTEHEYAITIAITGSGSTSPASSTTAKYVTASGDITAAPGTGYSFRDWDFSKTDEAYDVYSAGGYSSTSNPIHVLAQHDGTLTANFIANGYTVTLENMDADEGHKGTENVSVTYDASTNLTSSITCPTKTHYEFDGYWTSADGGETLTTQLINADGSWKADISGYTGASKEWVYADDITLYAKWTEVAYTITPSVVPAGAGSVNTVTDAHWITPSSTITATPANSAWTFDYWEYGTNVGPAGGSGNAITVTASQNSTITAHFKPRFSLVGSLQDDSGNGGMPGWEDYTKTFTVNSTSPMDLTRSCTLQADKTYKLQVHDLATSTNLGRSGCDPVCVLEENASLVMENNNNDVFLYTGGAGEYIFKITAIDGSDHPTLTVLRPYPVNFGQKYQDIDGSLHSGTTGGTASASAGSALTSGDYVTYNTSVSHTATATSPGYTFAGWWSSDAFEGNAFSNTNPMTYAVTSGDNTYAKFVETSTSVTLANDGNGKVQIGGADATSTTCGVTTTRELTAVPNEGYKFSSWSKSGDDITLSSTSTNPTTLSGNGSGATSGQTVTANFVERYSIKGTMNGEEWGTTHTLSNIGTNAGSKDTCFVTMTLPANTTYEFAIYDEQTGGWYKASKFKVYNMTYTNHTNWAFANDNTENCGIITAGKGTYKFIFNITDKTVTVIYPTSWQVNYGASVGGSVTSVIDGDSNPVPNGGYVVAGGSVTYTAAAASGYTFVGWCNNESYGEPFTKYNPWTNSSIAAASNAYAKFKSTNFVIYRTGDMSSDPRAAFDDVESYAGGPISEAIEFRMKVGVCDQWYSLCLPFTVDAVKVWDESAAQYYDLLPYYKDGSGYHGGHYIIRSPKQTTDLPIAEFADWNNPISAEAKPVKDTPYIIQWHNTYFQGKYVSFFGATGQTIATEFSAGDAPTDNAVVNVYTNNTMHSGEVSGAYMLEPDYGSSGAWLRLENESASRTIPPFECYILASEKTRKKYRAIRPGMTLDDTPSGWEDVLNSEHKSRIVVYTLTGLYIGQYDDCSFSDVAQHLTDEFNNGIFILHSDTESVKMMVGGK